MYLHDFYIKENGLIPVVFGRGGGMKRYFDQRARTTNSEIGPVTDQDTKNGIVHVLLYKYLEESANCVNVRNNRFTKSIYMNNGYMNLFSFLI